MVPSFAFLLRLKTDDKVPSRQRRQAGGGKGGPRDLAEKDWTNCIERQSKHLAIRTHVTVSWKACSWSHCHDPGGGVPSAS